MARAAQVGVEFAALVYSVVGLLTLAAVAWDLCASDRSFPLYGLITALSDGSEANVKVPPRARGRALPPAILGR